MKKKIAKLLCLCIMMLFALSACGKKDPTKVDYNGVTYRQLQEAVEKTVEALMQITEEDRSYYEQIGATEIVAMIDRWNEVTKDINLRHYKGCMEFTIAKAGDTLTTDTIVLFDNTSVDFQLIYSYHNMAQTGFMIEPVYTREEKMAKAGLNTLISVSIVFVVLILISLIIYAFNIFAYLDKRKAAKNKPTANEPAADQVVTQIEQRETQLTDDLELVAVIAAAIAAATGTSADDFVVRSIRRR